MKKLPTIAFCLLALQISTVIAAGANCEGFSAQNLNCFANGTTADADTVNANFKALLAKVEQLQTQINALPSQAKVDQLQTQVNSSIKNLKFFTLEAGVDTTHKDNYVTFTFPERVDYVGIQSIINDGNQMQAALVEQIDEKTARVHYLGTQNEGGRWIPSIKLVGIQIVR